MLRVTGSSTSDNVNSDLSLLWYVAHEHYATFDSESNSICGAHESEGRNFWLSYKDDSKNVNMTYQDELGNEYLYDATYFNALTVDEGDIYDAKKYFFNELKDNVSTTPPHLANADSLYRAETALSGNLVTI